MLYDMYNVQYVRRTRKNLSILSSEQDYISGLSTKVLVLDYKPSRKSFKNLNQGAD